MINWDQLARKHGFDNAEEMVVRMYYIDKLSTRDIADKLIISDTALDAFMEKHLLPKRDQKTASFARRRRGPECPYCGHPKSRIYWTDGDRYFERYRRCLKCEKYFLTQEIPTRTKGGKNG